MALAMAIALALSQVLAIVKALALSLALPCLALPIAMAQELALACCPSHGKGFWLYHGGAKDKAETDDAYNGGFNFFLVSSLILSYIPDFNIG